MVLRILLWFIHKDKEFESYSQQGVGVLARKYSCDSSTKIKNLKVTHNSFDESLSENNVVIHPQR